MKSKKLTKVLSVITAVIMTFCMMSVTAYAFNPDNYKANLTELHIGAPITGNDGRSYLPVTAYFTAVEDIGDTNAVYFLEGIIKAKLKDGTTTEGIGSGDAFLGMTLVQVKPGVELNGQNAYSWEWKEGGGKGVLKYNIPLLKNGETQAVEKSPNTGMMNVNAVKVGDQIIIQNQTVLKFSIPEIGSVLDGNEARFTVEDPSKYPKTIKVTEGGGGGNDISSCTIESATGDLVYTGWAQKPELVVTNGDTQLVEGKDFTVAYPEKMVDAGTYILTVTGTGDYTGSQTVEILVDKANNSLEAKAFPVKKALKFKASKVKKKKYTINLEEVMEVPNTGQGEMTYSKAGGSSKLSINSVTGKITVKKGTKPGIYRMKVSVSASGSNNYQTSVKQAWITVKIKK